MHFAVCLEIGGRVGTRIRYLGIAPTISERDQT